MSMRSPFVLSKMDCSGNPVPVCDAVRDRVCVCEELCDCVLDPDGDDVSDGVRLCVDDGVEDCEADVLKLGVCDAVDVREAV